MLFMTQHMYVLGRKGVSATVQGLWSSVRRVRRIRIPFVRMSWFRRPGFFIAFRVRVRFQLYTSQETSRKSSQGSVACGCSILARCSGCYRESMLSVQKAETSKLTIRFPAHSLNFIFLVIVDANCLDHIPKSSSVLLS